MGSCLICSFYFYKLWNFILIWFRVNLDWILVRNLVRIVFSVVGKLICRANDGGLQRSEVWIGFQVRRFINEQRMQTNKIYMSISYLFIVKKKLISFNIKIILFFLYKLSQSHTIASYYNTITISLFAGRISKIFKN